MTARPDLAGLPGLPRDEAGPVFAAPWEAAAFAMTLLLHERGHFTWKEWTGHLAREIAAARERGEADTGADYYEHWLAALEAIVAAKGLVLDADLAVRREEWAEAARETEHGKPIELRRR